MERNFPVIPIFRNFRPTSRGTPKISEWNSGKCLFHSLPNPEFLVEWKAPRVSFPGRCTGWALVSRRWKVWEGLLSNSKATVYKNTRIAEVVNNSGQHWTSSLLLKKWWANSRQGLWWCHCSSPFKDFWILLWLRRLQRMASFKRTGKILAYSCYFSAGWSQHDPFWFFNSGWHTRRNWHYRKHQKTTSTLQEPVENRSNTDHRDLPIREVFSRSDLTPSQLNE